MLKQLLVLFVLSIALLVQRTASGPTASQPIGDLAHRISLHPRRLESRLPLKNTGSLNGWVANISVGSEKPIEVYLDTGSNRLMLTGEQYHPGKTAIDLHHPVKMFYAGGDGGFAKMYRDDVTLGSSRLKVKKVAFGHYSTIKSSSGLNILGLSHSGHGYNKNLQREGGTFVLNDPDTRSYVWHKVNDSSFVGEWVVNSHVIGIKRPVMLDSGTSENFINFDDFHFFAKHYDLEIISPHGADPYYRLVGDCRREITLAFDFGGGQKICVPKHRFWSKHRKTKDGRCYAHVFSLNDYWADLWILGMVFMQDIQVGYDFTGKRLGFRLKEGVEASHCD